MGTISGNVLPTLVEQGSTLSLQCSCDNKIQQGEGTGGDEGNYYVFKENIN